MPRRTHRPPVSALLRRAIGVSLLVVSLAAPGTAGAPALPADDDPPTAAWKLAVWRHIPGKADGALQTAADIPYWRAANALKGKDALDDRRFLIRALILHTDLAIVQRQTAERRGTSAADERADGGSFVLADGHATGRRQGSPHWSVAMQVAVILATWRAPESRRNPDATPDAETRRIALSWFHTVNALFLHWGEGSLRYADTGLLHYPGDAVLHLYLGTVHQMYANGRVQQFISASAEGRGAANAPQTASVELARAETDLRRALALDPTLAEARIRLAHVVGDLGRHDEAIGLVEDALRATLPPFFLTYATLILGRNQTRAGRLDEARTAFDRAAILAPTAQAPRIGRSQVALMAGRPADALSALTDVLGPDRPPAEAPAEAWAIYFRVHDPVATEQLATLRSEVR